MPPCWGCLCCALMPAFAKDAGWQWYNERLKSRDTDKPPVPATPPLQMDILQKQALLQQATKKALAEAIMYPSVPAFVKYFRLQNYWTQQAGLFSMSAKKAMLAHPELDYNLQYSHYNGTVKNQLAADYAEQRRAISTLAQHFGVMFFYRGREAIDGQLVQVIQNFRETYGLSVIPVSVDGVINPMLPDSRTDRTGRTTRREVLPRDDAGRPEKRPGEAAQLWIHQPGRPGETVPLCLQRL